jgi:hypothetical protein
MLNWIFIVRTHRNKSEGRHFDPLWHIILISSQAVFGVLSGKAANTNFIVFAWSNHGLKPRSTAFVVNLLIITSPMQLVMLGTDYIYGYQSIYNTITHMTAPTKITFFFIHTSRSWYSSFKESFCPRQQWPVTFLLHDGYWRL